MTMTEQSSDVIEATIVPSATEVRESVGRARTHLEAAADEIVWQVQHRAWETLGYRDWDHMRDAEYGGIAVWVPRADRPELVARLRREGLTQQQIADTLGVTQMTVNRDLNKHLFIEDEPSSGPVVNTRGQQRPATYTRHTPPAAPEPDDDPQPLQPTQHIDYRTGEIVDNDDRPYDTTPTTRPTPNRTWQPTPTDAERRDADRVKARTHSYTRIGEAMMVLASYGEYDDLDVTTADFELRFLNPPELLRHMTRAKCEAAARFALHLADRMEQYQ